MADKTSKNKKMMPKPSPRPNYQIWIIVTLLALVLGVTYFNRSNSTTTLTMQRFERMLAEGDVAEVIVIRNQDAVEVTLKPSAYQKPEYRNELDERGPFSTTGGGQYRLRLLSPDSFNSRFEKAQEDLPEEERIDYEVVDRSDFTSVLSTWGFLFLLLFGFWFLMRRMAGAGGPGGQIFNIGKSRAALFDAENKVNITFDNVAGLDEAKEEIKEIVEFLKNPAKYTNLGGKIPKGALLIGTPGTGKTLLAKAVAGEAGVPFFSLSGSDFVEMFVGVGAARVRDLFKQAKEKAPCIIFIDEIERGRSGPRQRGHARLKRRAGEYPKLTAGRNGRFLHRFGGNHPGGHQPARRAGLGAAAPRPLRPANID